MIEGPYTYDEADADSLSGEQEAKHNEWVAKIAERHGFPLSDWTPKIPDIPDRWKWAYDGQTHRVHVWHSDEHPERTHRPEAERLMGRPPKTVDGDILGVATRTGGEVKVESFYGARIPQVVVDHFEAYGKARVADTVQYRSYWGRVHDVPEQSAPEWAQENLAKPKLSLKEKIKRVFKST